MRQGGINAFTTNGEGGNISLNIRDVLLMRDSSKIDATAFNRSNGGNIRISSPLIIGLENSDINASAIAGNGGNINITTQGLFGLVSRPQQTPNSDITASSQFGLSGTVSVNNLALRPDTGIVELSEEVSDPDTQVAKRCMDTQGNQFIASGRGGLPASPDRYLTTTRPWQDMRLITITESDENPTSDSVSHQVPSQDALIEASGWHLSEDNEVVLSSTEASPAYRTPNCLG